MTKVWDSCLGGHVRPFMGARFNCDQKMSISEFNPRGSYWIHYRGHTLCSGGDFFFSPSLCEIVLILIISVLTMAITISLISCDIWLLAAPYCAKKFTLPSGICSRTSPLWRCFNEGRCLGSWFALCFRKHWTCCSRCKMVRAATVGGEGGQWFYI